MPDDFRFTVKAPNSVTLTHLYKKKKSDPLVPNAHFLSPSLFQTFLASMEPLRDVMGPIMFQFEYLNKQKMGSQGEFQELFGTFARQLPPSYMYALEVRNPRYLNRAYFEWLGRVKLLPVLVQGYWMPPIMDIYQNWRELILQHGTVLIRLLGPDRKGIEKGTGKRWNQIVAPKDADLARIASMVTEILDHGADVYLNVNNHYEGSAPLTIERVQQQLTG